MYEQLNKASIWHWVAPKKGNLERHRANQGF
jgi:hypothetical protein